MAFSAAVRDAVGVASAAPAEVSEAAPAEVSGAASSRGVRVRRVSVAARTGDQQDKRYRRQSQDRTHRRTSFFRFMPPRRGYHRRPSAATRRTTIYASRNPPPREQERYRGEPVDLPYATVAAGDVGFLQAPKTGDSSRQRRRAEDDYRLEIDVPVVAAISAVVVLAVGCGGGEPGAAADAAASRGTSRPAAPSGTTALLKLPRPPGPQPSRQPKKPQPSRLPRS